MRKIFEAVTAYRNWDKVYPQMKRMFVEMSISDQRGPKIPDRNLFSLDDRCEFSGKEYTVRQLIAQMKRGSKVGQEFAEAVYQEGQKQGTLEQMSKVGDNEGVGHLYIGDKEIPANVIFSALGQSSIGRQAFQLMDYMIAIHTVTHPKNE